MLLIGALVGSNIKKMNQKQPIGHQRFYFGNTNGYQNLKNPHKIMHDKSLKQDSVT